MATQWTITIDWDRNGNFTGTYDDVTDRVISASWALGIMTAYQETAEAATFSLELKNDDRRYSPEYSGSPLSGKVVPHTVLFAYSLTTEQPPGHILSAGLTQSIPHQVSTASAQLLSSPPVRCSFSKWPRPTLSYKKISVQMKSSRRCWKKSPSRLRSIGPGI